jgi:D-inositol-3-phosphate glycosyltransferase
VRIALVSEHASPLTALGGVDAGGQNVHVAQLALALGRRGVQVVVYTRRDDRTLPRRVRLAPGVSVEHVDAGPPEPVAKDELLPYMGAFAGELITAWERRPPALVHSHFWMSGLASLEAARPYDVPVVHTFHALGVVKRRHQGSDDTSPRGRLGLEEWIARDADRIVATCSDEVFELLRLGADRHRITVVPCGVDVDQFTPRGPVAPRTPDRRRLLAVGRLVRRKGFGNVISAVAELPGVELLIAGGPEPTAIDDDPEARRLRALAESLGVGDRVRLLGRVDRGDLPAVIRSADAVVSVPWYEPFGIVPLEAMACGVPVVASAVGGLIDTVVHGMTGLHVPPRRPDRLAAALRELLGDNQLRQRLGANGVERARRSYTWDRVADSTLEVYRLELQRRRARVRQGARA